MMAGDWIPVELATPRKPEVLRIARRTGKSPHEVLGLMVALWAWISEHSTDGNVDACVDDVASTVGASTEFWHVVADEGWLIIGDEKVTVPNADKWIANGSKSRLAKNERQKRWRAKVAQNVDACVDAQPSTREEKRREEKSNTPLPPNPPKQSATAHVAIQHVEGVYSDWAKARGPADPTKPWTFRLPPQWHNKIADDAATMAEAILCLTVADFDKAWSNCPNPAKWGWGWLRQILTNPKAEKPPDALQQLHNEMHDRKIAAMKAAGL